MADLRLHSSTSNLIRFRLTHSTTGQGLTGLTEASSGLIISTVADNESSATTYTAGGSTIETISTLGTFATPTTNKCRFKEVDSTNHKGLYEFQFANARFSVASAKRLVISVTGATNLLDAAYEIQLVQFDPYDATRLGLSALPNAAAGANGGLPTGDANAAVKVQTGTGTGQLDFTSGRIKADAVYWNASAVATPDTAGYPKVTIKSGTGTGELSISSGVVAADEVKISGDSVAADNAESFFDGTGYAGTNNVIPTVTSVTNRVTANTDQIEGVDATNQIRDSVLSDATRFAGADIATIKGYVDDIGVAGAGLSAIPWNAAWDAEVQSEVQDAIEVNNLDHLVKLAVDTDFPTTVHLNSVVGYLADNGTSATFDRTTDSLEAIRDRGDAAWTTATGFSTLTQADVRSAVGLASANLDTQLSTIDDFLDTEIAAIKAKTDNLPTDPADASDIAASFSTVNTKLDTIDDFIDTEVAAIKAKTDQLTFTTANKVDATIQAAGDFAQAAADKVWSTASRTLTAFGFSVTVGTNNDKTGYSLSAGGVQAIWDALTSALTTTGSIGKLLVDNINATILSRSSHTAADVWSVATRLLTAGTNIVLAKGTGVTGFNDLSASEVNTEVSSAVVDALNVDTYAEPGQEAPPATTTLVKKIGYLYKLARNRKSQTTTTLSLYADNATTVDQKATISDDGTTYEHGELVSGP